MGVTVWLLTQQLQLTGGRVPGLEDTSPDHGRHADDEEHQDERDEEEESQEREQSHRLIGLSPLRHSGQGLLPRPGGEGGEADRV